MTHVLEVRSIGELDGRSFAFLESRDGTVRAVELHSHAEAWTLAFALWGDRFRISWHSVPRGLRPGPVVWAALERPCSIDEAIPTPPAFIDWWRRVTLGELRRGQLVGQGDAGDPLEHQEDEAPKKPRRRIGDPARKYETDGRDVVCLEVGIGGEDAP